MQNNERQKKGGKKEYVNKKASRSTCEAADICENRHVCANSVCMYRVPVLACACVCTLAKP